MKKQSNLIQMVVILLALSMHSVPAQNNFDIDTTIVPVDSLNQIGGLGYYYKIIHWQGPFNPMWSDSVFQMLLDSNFDINKFWYPAVVGVCLDPSIHEKEIVKLTEPDTLIFKLGYSELTPTQGDHCIQFWKQYVVRDISTNIQINMQDFHPENFSLSQNFPNPFNPATTIRFVLSKGSKVTLKVYNILGKEIVVLIDGKKTAGIHSVLWDASGFESGIYFYKLETENYFEVKKLILLQ